MSLAPMARSAEGAGGPYSPSRFLDHADMAEIMRIAAAYPPHARHVPAWEREAYLTEAQQLAWLVRFDPEGAAEAMSAACCRSIPQNRADRVRPGVVPHPENHHG